MRNHLGRAGTSAAALRRRTKPRASESGAHAPHRAATDASPVVKPGGHDDGTQVEHTNPLRAILDPRTIAVIGATEKPGSVGRTVFENLLAGPFGGSVYAVNPRHPAILGRPAFPNIKSVPGPIDLAVIVTPAPTVPALVAECAAAGVRGVVVISAGFKEVGPEGVELERQVLAAAQGKLRVLGPNCLGVMRPAAGLNATFSSPIAHPGKVAFLSQSGALCSAILDWSLREKVGFSAFVSLGSMLDISWGDLISYLGDDPHTKSIVIYMESIGDARSFLSAAREVALAKPIIVIKVGRTEAAAKVAASHTGSLTGSDEVLEAAFRRVGVLRVNTIGELFEMAEVLSKQPAPKGPRLAIVTNAGGPSALATDMLITGGGQLAGLEGASVDALNAFLPSAWSHHNPVDILGDAGADRYAKALEVVAKDPNNDGLLVILTPQTMSEAAPTAEAVKALAASYGKPVLASWMGADQVAEGVRILNEAQIPTYEYPDTAARAFTYMWRYTFNLRGIYETPALPKHSEEAGAHRARAREIMATARASGRTLLSEFDSKEVLKAYGLPTVETRTAATADEAVACAEALGFPVVVKLYSQTITHKTEMGGVQLNLNTPAAVRRAWHVIETSVTEKAGREHFQGVTVQPMVKLDGYELILGSSPDPQFGPVLLFGAGGQLVEVFRDRALALPPLNATLARRMMEQTRVYQALQGVRGRKAVDLAALEQLLVRFSQLVVEQPWIKEIDINPLLASASGLVALDARIILHGAEVPEAELPRTAVRPYPIQYVSTRRLSDGRTTTIRPIRPEDEPMVVRFHEALSDNSVYFRYLSPLKLAQRTTHERLTRVCFIDYDREIAFVAERKDPVTGNLEILGISRLIKAPATPEAEFAIIVADKFQRTGLGTQLMHRLIEFARDEKLARLAGCILEANRAMLHLVEKLGFRMVHLKDEPLVFVELDLAAGKGKKGD